MLNVQIVGHRETLKGPIEPVGRGDFVKLVVVDGHMLATECGVTISDERVSIDSWDTGMTLVVVKPRMRVMS